MMDEDGEPLMDLDGQSDREASPQPRFDDGDDLDEDEWRRSRSPTPVLEDKTGKPRKRLVKKSGKEATPSPARSGSPGNELNDWDEDQEEEEDETGSLKKRKGCDLLKVGMGKGESFGKKEKKRKKESSSRDTERGGKGWTPSGLKGHGSGRAKDQEADPEMEELWDTIAGNDSEV